MGVKDLTPIPPLSSLRVLSPCWYFSIFPQFSWWLLIWYLKEKLPFSYSRLFEKVYLILYSLIPKGFLHFILQTSYPNLQIFNPSHLLIDIHILCTVLYAFTKVLTRKICLTIKNLLHWWPFFIILITFMYELEVIM